MCKYMFSLKWVAHTTLCLLGNAMLIFYFFFSGTWATLHTPWRTMLSKCWAVRSIVWVGRACCSAGLYSNVSQTAHFLLNYCKRLLIVRAIKCALSNQNIGDARWPNIKPYRGLCKKHCTIHSSLGFRLHYGCSFVMCTCMRIVSNVEGKLLVVYKIP